jgi:hypothetical protein
VTLSLNTNSSSCWLLLFFLTEAKRKWSNEDMYCRSRHLGMWSLPWNDINPRCCRGSCGSPVSPGPGLPYGSNLVFERLAPGSPFPSCLGSPFFLVTSQVNWPKDEVFSHDNG